MVLFISLLIVALLLEGTLTSLPLVYIVLLCWAVIRRDAQAFVAAFITGIFLDVFAVRLVWQSSLFLVVSVFLILLYQRKYEIYSYPFVGVAGFLGSFVFLLLLGSNNLFLQAGISSCIGVILFAILKKVHAREE